MGFWRLWAVLPYSVLHGDQPLKMSLILHGRARRWKLERHGTSRDAKEFKVLINWCKGVCMQRQEREIVGGFRIILIIACCKLQHIFVLHCVQADDFSQMYDDRRYIKLSDNCSY